ncbi:MAG: transcriptional regulator FilR1 domain-containing protein [Archaeoglobaceae archaeon]
MVGVRNLLSSPKLIEVLEEAWTPRTREEIRNRTSISTSHLSQITNKLISLNLIEQKGEKFKILPKGELVLRANKVTSSYEKFLTRFDSYINLYELRDIPENLLLRVYEIQDFVVIERSEECFLPHQEFMENLYNSEEIRGYSSVLFPEYIKAFLGFAEYGKKIELVVNREVFQQILDNYRDELEKGLECNNVRFYLSQKNFKFSFIVTDLLFSISFYLKSGLFDYKRDFFCNSNEGIGWGMELFKYVKDNSLRIGIKEAKEMAQYL